MDMLEGLIEERDIPLITGLKPSRTFQVDDYCWIYNKSGQYTVRSGYLLASNQMEVEKELIGPSLTPLKSQACKIKTSRKIKHLLWQALSGCLATCSRLTDRHCGHDRICPHCGAADETINHVLFECPPAVQVWALSSIPTVPGLFPSQSLFTNLDFLFWSAKASSITEEQLVPDPWIMWYIWKARNEKVFTNNDTSPPDTLSLAVSESKSWKLAQAVEQMEESDEEEEEREHSNQEEQLSRGEVTCQTDASWIKDANSTGLSFIIDGVLDKGFGQRNVKCCLSPLQAELDALVWALECVFQLGLRSIHFETDCSTLIKIIDDPEDWPIFFTEIEAFYLARARLSFFSISTIARTKNVRADVLAKNARARDLQFSHVGYQVPDWLAHEAILSLYSNNMVF